MRRFGCQIRAFVRVRGQVEQHLFAIARVKDVLRLSVGQRIPMIFGGVADIVLQVEEESPPGGLPAWYVEQDSLRARSTRIDGQIRDIENGAAGEGAKASGMSLKEYSLARERVLHWYLESRGGSAFPAESALRCQV